jgi:hypothetical protein
MERRGRRRSRLAIRPQNGHMRLDILKTEQTNQMSRVSENV